MNVKIGRVTEEPTRVDVFSLREESYICRHLCALCGGPTWKTRYVAQNICNATACQDCMKAFEQGGSAALAARMAAYAKCLEAEATNLRECMRDGVLLPTLTEFKAFAETLEKRFEG
jgi:hypothetical protein